LLSQSPGQETNNTEIQNTSTQTEEEVEPPTLEEVRIAVQSLKNNKALGVDRITEEIYKIGGPALQARVHNLIKTIWMKEIIPKDWAISMICPIYKKGDKTQCSNYRGVSLLCTAYKIFITILLNRLKYKF